MMKLIRVGDNVPLPPQTVNASIADDAGPGVEEFKPIPANVAMEEAGDGVVRITLRPGVTITADDGNWVRARFLGLTGGRGAVILLQITGVESVSRDAVRFLSEAVTVTAFAILGSTAVDRVIAHGRRGLPEPQCPTQYFSDEQAAIAWLHTVAPRAERSARRTANREPMG